MLRHAAERQALVVSLNPEAFRAPGHRRQTPAIARRLSEKIGDADFKRIDADRAAQRLLADGDKALQFSIVGQGVAHQIKEVRGEKVGHGRFQIGIEVKNRAAV